MRSNKLFDSYRSLLGCGSSEQAIRVQPFVEGSPHRLGVSPDGEPILFVSCADGDTSTPVRLRLIRADFKVVCLLNVDGYVSEGEYCTVRLLTSQGDLVRHFLDIFELAIISLPERPSTAQFASEINTLAQLFSGIGKCSQSVIQGLWAELFVIKRSSAPLALLRAWHVSTSDRYDFNDGQDKVEVKSSSNNGLRIHSFAAEQLHPGPSSKLVVASLPVIACGGGVTITDLEEAIVARLDDVDAKIKLKSVILKTVGERDDDSPEEGFDAALAEDGLAFYDCADIPKVDLDSVPAGVSNIHFSVDLSGVSAIRPSDLASPLFSCL